MGKRKLSGAAAASRSKKQTISTPIASASELSTSAQRPSGDDSQVHNEDVESEEVAQRIAESIVGGKKDTRKRSAVRAKRDLAAEVLNPMCERYAAEVSLFPDLVCWVYKNSPVGKCGDCKKKNKPCSPTPATSIPALNNLMDVAVRFLGGIATQAALDVTQDEFDRSRIAVKARKKVADAAASKAPWAPGVEATLSSSTSLVTALEAVSANLTLLSRVTTNHHMNLMLLLTEIRDDFRKVNGLEIPDPLCDGTVTQSKGKGKEVVRGGEDVDEEISAETLI